MQKCSHLAQCWVCPSISQIRNMKVHHSVKSRVIHHVFFSKVLDFQNVLCIMYNWNWFSIDQYKLVVWKTFFLSIILFWKYWLFTKFGISRQISFCVIQIIKTSCTIIYLYLSARILVLVWYTLNNSPCW